MKGCVVLEDGVVFHGNSFGASGEALGEVVFNTSLTGYQEILTDPSYKSQIVTMTYPLIGNYGVNEEDIESCGISAEGFVVKESCKYPSNFACTKSLGQYLIDKFVGDSIEVDVDAISDGVDTMICGIMEHIEEAGIHSGDSACVLPPHTLSESIVDEIRHATKAIAGELTVVGLLNIQYAINEETVYILEVNPRASRTVPFVSKASGTPWAKIAAKVMTGIPLKEIDEAVEREIEYFAVKESVLPFNKFPGADIMLGPEMKSTGEVMGLDRDFGLAYAKSQEAAYNPLPRHGKVFISVRNSMRRNIIFMVKKLADLGFQIFATEGTAKVLRSSGVNAKPVFKIGEGKPNILDLIKANAVDLIINVPATRKALIDSKPIRSATVSQNIPYITTLEGAQAAISGMDSLEKTGFTVKSIQEHCAVDLSKKNMTEDFSIRRKMFN